MSQGHPWSKDQIGSWIVAGAAGQQAYRNGAGAFDATDIALRWRFWYKAQGLSIVFCVLAVGLYKVVPTHIYQPLLVAQGVLSLLCLGLTYAKLVHFSGFKRRLLFRVFWPLARRLPNVANFWLYMVPAIPTWLMLYNSPFWTGQLR